MRFTVRFAAIALGMAAMAGSAMAQETRGGQTGAPGSSTQRPGDTPPGARTDSQGFVNDMAIAGMTEVELGKIAAEHGASADVKSFGQMMVTDHSKANEELKQAAAALNINPTTQLDQKHRDLVARLSKLKGAEFDREYATAMVQGHEEVLSKLRARAGSAGAAAGNSPAKTTKPGDAASAHGAHEQALTEWAAKTVPTVEKHLERAKALQKNVGK